MERTLLIEKLDECLVNMQGISEIIELLTNMKDLPPVHRRDSLYQLMWNILVDSCAQLAEAIDEISINKSYNPDNHI